MSKKRNKKHHLSGKFDAESQKPEFSTDDADTFLDDDTGIDEDDYEEIVIPEFAEDDTVADEDNSFVSTDEPSYVDEEGTSPDQADEAAPVEAEETSFEQDSAAASGAEDAGSSELTEDAATSVEEDAGSSEQSEDAATSVEEDAASSEQSEDAAASVEEDAASSEQSEDAAASVEEDGSSTGNDASGEKAGSPHHDKLSSLLNKKKLSETWDKVRSSKTSSNLSILGIVLMAIVLVILLLYFHERKKPVAVTERFLESVQTMDFDTMRSLIKDGDLSALEDADLFSESYQEFFENVNSRMTFEIQKNEFRMNAGKARVTAHIRYVDGTSIYQSVIGDFMRELIDSAFSGDSLSLEESQEKIAGLLKAKESEFENLYAETEIRYPLEKIQSEWKIASLDDQSIRIMTANFKSIEEEIRKAIGQSSEEEAAEGAEAEAIEDLSRNGAAGDVTQDDSAAEEAENSMLSDESSIVVMGDAVTDAANNPLLNMDSAQMLLLESEKFSIRYSSYALARDYAGHDCLLYYYTYTNRSGEESSPMFDVDLVAFQSGKSLPDAIPNDRDAAIRNFYAKVGPGESITVCHPFQLIDRSNVTIQADMKSSSELNSISTQMLKVE